MTPAIELIGVVLVGDVVDDEEELIGEVMAHARSRDDEARAPRGGPDSP
jgi:hypothetical protein